VIVNFRTPALTTACLASLAPEVQVVPGVHVVVVENGSGDDSAAQIQAAIDAHGWTFARLVVSSENTGFSGGNNLGIASGEPAEFVLLLNSDTIVHTGCLARCLAVMSEHPEAGAMSCRVLNSDGTMQNVTRRFPSPLLSTCAALGLPWRFPQLFAWADADDPDWDRTSQARDVDWLGGAFVFIRSAAFPDGKVRLDEDFFFYGEDVVLSYGLKQRGYTRRYDPLASIVHLGGASSDPSRMPRGARATQRWRARYLVQSKCYGSIAAKWLQGVDLVVAGRWYVRALVSRSRRPSELGEIQGLLKMIVFSGEAP